MHLRMLQWTSLTRSMCFDAVFETIFNITDLVQQVVDTANDIAAQSVVTLKV